MEHSPDALSIVRGLAGAVLGGLLGYFVFFWIARQGFYALILPGTVLGLGFGLACRRKYIAAAVACGLAALALGIFTEWRFAPFAEDTSISFFLTHLHRLKPVTWLMIGLGAFFAFYLAQGPGGFRSRGGPPG